jgi:hypothetical protein
MFNLDPIAMDRDQIQHLEGAVEIWRRYLAAQDLRQEVAGAMGWKSVKGREYLIHSRYDRKISSKQTTSLGPRSPETEAIKASFERRREAADTALAGLEQPLDRAARLGKALRIGRMNSTAAAVLRELRRDHLLGPDLYVIGSTAIAGYEARTKTFLPKGLETAHGDLDLLTTRRDGREALDELLPVVHRADRSFRIQATAHHASIANDRGFRIDLHLRRDLERRVISAGGFYPDQTELLRQALLAMPVELVAFAKNGMPLEMTAIDPRSFSLLNYTEAGRRRKSGDSDITLHRALAVGRMVQLHWTEPFPAAVLEHFSEFAAHVAPADPESEAPEADAGDEDMKFYGP